MKEGSAHKMLSVVANNKHSRMAPFIILSESSASCHLFADLQKNTHRHTQGEKATLNAPIRTCMV